MGTVYYVLAKTGDKQFVAIRVGKYIDPDIIDDWFRHPMLMAIILWCGKKPKIVSEYELEEMEYRDKDIEIIWLDPDDVLEYDEEDEKWW